MAVEPQIFWKSCLWIIWWHVIELRAQNLSASFSLSYYVTYMTVRSVLSTEWTRKIYIIWGSYQICHTKWTQIRILKKFSNSTIKTDNSKQYVITGISLALKDVACISSRVQSSCIQDPQVFLDKLTGGIYTKFYIGLKATPPCTTFFKWTAAIYVWLFRKETMTFPGTVRLLPIAHYFLQASNTYLKFSVFRVSLFQLYFNFTSKTN
jgi:hypothetical protein